MTRRSLSWIDPARWAQLLERNRLDSPRQGGPGEESAGTGNPETGGTGRAGAATASRDLPSLDPARLDALLDQARAVPGVEGAFVCDPTGATLAASRMETLELSLGPAFMGLFAHQRNTCGGPERGMLMLAFGGRRRLHLMETVTPHGRYGFGVVADRTLPDTVLLKLQLELGRVVRRVPGPS